VSAPLDLHLANDLAAMAGLIDAVDRFGAAHRLPADIVNALQVAVDEVVTNAITHGYAPGARGEITVRLQHRPDRVEAEIEDDGAPFDPLQAPPPNLGLPAAERPIGGLGIHLVRNLMDKVSYVRRDGRNLLKLVKNLDNQGRVERAEMEVIESSADGVAIMEPRGRMDALGAKPFGDRAVELMREGSTRMLIDLAHIQYISSAGFRALLIAHKHSIASNGKLVLCGLSAEVRRMFELGAFLDVFTICGTREEGLAKAK
jgi:anti-anti-sigma factor